MKVCNPRKFLALQYLLVVIVALSSHSYCHVVIIYCHMVTVTCLLPIITYVDIIYHCIEAVYHQVYIVA